MDELARRYILLCLRLERLSAGFVDSYNGPSELSEAAAAEPIPLPTELHDEAMALRAAVAELPARDAAGRRRRAWLDEQLRAIAALARRAGGEEIAYLDLVEQLFGVPIRPVPETHLEEALARLDEAVPGNGELGSRAQAYRATLRVPAERVLGAVADSAARFRRLTERDFALPTEEGIDWEEAHDRPWGAYATFTGRGRTRIIINVDLPVDIGLVAYLASHEGYPGHHAEHVMKERSLVLAGVGEATMRTMNTPEAMLAEGMADVGREVVMSDRELEGELERIGEFVGVRADWVRALAVYRADRELQGVTSNAALMLHHEGRPAAEVRAWMATFGSEDVRLDHAMRVLADPVGSTYPFTYTEGSRIIREWLAVAGQTTGFARLLTEQLSPAQLIAEAAG